MCPRIILPFFALRAASADFCAAPLVVAGHVYDLSLLSAAPLSHTAANGWAYRLSVCARVQGAAVLSPRCLGHALAYQETDNGSCFALAVYHDGARAAPGGGGLQLELRAGDACGDTPRRLRVTLQCAADASAIDSVVEDCGKCCYTALVRSPAGCAAVCPVDAATGSRHGRERGHLQLQRWLFRHCLWHGKSRPRRPSVAAARCAAAAPLPCRPAAPCRPFFNAAARALVEGPPCAPGDEGAERPHPRVCCYLQRAPAAPVADFAPFLDHSAALA